MIKEDFNSGYANFCGILCFVLTTQKEDPEFMQEKVR